MIFNFLFIFLFSFISKSNCSNKNEIKKATLNMNQKLGKLRKLDSNEVSQILSVGNVYEELLYDSKNYIFNFNKSDIQNNTLYFHFYPLDDCRIKILSNDTSVKIQKRNNYNNKLFYAQINSGNKTNSISFKIFHINDDLDKDSNSTCRLIINSFSKSNNNNIIPNLNLIEKKPTFLHFDKNLKKIRLFYNLQDMEKKSIVFSFFIKDKVKFNVKFEKTGFNKTISYIDKFIIKKKYISNYENINILLTLKEEDKESDVIVRVIGDNSKLNYLQRNFLNLEFILSEEKTQYYYMEVYDNEEGEIMLHDKRKNGRLASKIFNEDRFPTESDFKIISNEFDDEFDIYSQKLRFTTSDCKNINNKCYLLITYFGPFNLSNITGTEYTLLTRIWDNFEAIPQIVNIPLNEYVFGHLDEKSVNHHYYTVLIPEDSENITLEIHGFGIKTYAIKGIKKINSISIKGNIYGLQYNNTYKTEIIILKKTDFNLKSFKNQYISFSFFREDIKFQTISYYYFRVLQPDSINNIVIYPLDSNFENLCKTDLISKSCYFLLKNDYNELLYKQRINELYDNSNYYSIVNILKKKEDYYSINLNNIEFKGSKKFNIRKLNMNYFVIIKFYNRNLNSKSLTISSTIKEVKPSIQIYSYKLIYLEKKINLKLDNKPQLYKLKIIRNQKNPGVINFKINNDTKESININNNYGRQISYLINQDFDSIEFDRKDNITLFLKFDYKKQGKKFEEISYGDTPKYISEYSEFPLLFYIKSANNKGLDFNILLTDKIGNLDITGYYADFSYIIDVDNDENLINESSEDEYEKGIYDNGTQAGIIEFNTINGSNSDLYYIVNITLSKDNLMPKNANLSSTIFINAYPREDKNNIIPPGKFMRGIFDLDNNEEGKIHYIKENYACTIFFSSNYKNLRIAIDNNTNTTITENKSLEYAKVYRINGYIDKFTIKLIDNENITRINNSNININYIFKYEIKTKYYKNNTKTLENDNQETENDNSETKKDNQEIRNISKITNIKLQLNNRTSKGNKRDFNISFIINKTNEYRSNRKNQIPIPSPNYYLRLYQKSDILEDEELFSLALPSSKIFYYNESLRNNNSEINFTLKDLDNNEDYQIILIIKSFPNHHEFYEVYNFEINQETKDENNSSIGKLFLLIIISIPVVIIIIVVAIFSIFLIRMLKKNKELEEKVRNISFALKDDGCSSSLEDDLNPKVAYV